MRNIMYKMERKIENALTLRNKPRTDSDVSEPIRIHRMLRGPSSALTSWLVIRAIDKWSYSIPMRRNPLLYGAPVAIQVYRVGCEKTAKVIL